MLLNQLIAIYLCSHILYCNHTMTYYWPFDSDGGFPSQGPIMWSFDVSFVTPLYRMSLNQIISIYSYSSYCLYKFHINKHISHICPEFTWWLYESVRSCLKPISESMNKWMKILYKVQFHWIKPNIEDYCYSIALHAAFCLWDKNIDGRVIIWDDLLGVNSSLSFWCYMYVSMNRIIVVSDNGLVPNRMDK